MKRTIALCLGIAMLLLMIPGTAFADKNESITVGKTKRLTLNTGEATFHGRWESSDPYAVDIISQDGITCEIKALQMPTYGNPVSVYCTYEVQTPRRTFQTKVEVYWVTVSESNASSGGDYTISVSESTLNIDMANGGGVMVICGVPFSNDVWLEFEATQGKCGYSFDYDGNRAWVGIYPESTGKGACVVKLIRSTGKNKVSIMQNRRSDIQRTVPIILVPQERSHKNRRIQRRERSSILVYAADIRRLTVSRC